MNGTCAVCKRETDKICSRCESVYYCSTEHQKLDWNKHFSLCAYSKIETFASVKKVDDYEESKYGIGSTGIHKRRSDDVSAEEKYKKLLMVLEETKTDMETEIDAVDKKINDSGGICPSKDVLSAIKEIAEKLGFSKITERDIELLTKNPKIRDALETIKICQAQIKTGTCKEFADPEVIAKIVHNSSKSENKSQRQILDEWQFHEVFDGLKYIHECFVHSALIYEAHDEVDIEAQAKFIAETFKYFSEYLSLLCPYLKCLGDYTDNQTEREQCIKSTVKRIYDIRAAININLVSWKARSNRFVSSVKRAATELIKFSLRAIAYSGIGVASAAFLIVPLGSVIVPGTLAAVANSNGWDNPMFTTTFRDTMLVLQAYGIEVWPELHKYLPSGMVNTAHHNAVAAVRQSWGPAMLYAYKPIESYVNGVLGTAWSVMANVAHYWESVSSMYVGVCAKAVSYVFTNPVAAGTATWILSWLLGIVITVLIATATAYIIKKAKQGVRAAVNIWLDWRESENTKTKIKQLMTTYLKFVEDPTSALEPTMSNQIPITIELTDDDITF